MRPTAAEIYNIIINSVKDFLERLKSFTRWMDGTCLLCPPIVQNDDPYIFSFFEDVAQVKNKRKKTIFGSKMAFVFFRFQKLVKLLQVYKVWPKSLSVMCTTI